MAIPELTEFRVGGGRNMMGTSYQGQIFFNPDYFDKKTRRRSKPMEIFTKYVDEYGIICNAPEEIKKSWEEYLKDRTAWDEIGDTLKG